VNHAVYLNYLEHARFETLAASGFPVAEMETRGWAVHVVRIEADYRRECRFGDHLLVRTGVEEVRKSSMVLRQELLRFRGPAPSALPLETVEEEPDLAGDPGSPPDGWRDAGEVALEARIVAVWIGPDGRPMRVPAEVRAALGEERG
jgi:YbgC/YbaW family acyl-CoA thioester hydrolase